MMRARNIIVIIHADGNVDDYFVVFGGGWGLLVLLLVLVVSMNSSGAPRGRA